MNRKFATLFAVLVMASMTAVFFAGCDGCSCGKKPAAPVAGADDQGQATPGNPPPAVAPGIPERPSRTELIASIGEMIPYDAVWVAVFEINRVRDQLHKVGRIAPKLIRSRDYHDVHARILDLYGIDTDKVEGPCLLAGLKTGGRFLVCNKAESVVEPVDAARWTVDTDKGPIVMRRNALVSTGVVDGRLVAGDQNAVFAAVRHYRDKQPSLGAMFKRDKGPLADLSAQDGWRDFALFFPAMNPGWCDPAICRGTAIFGGSQAMVAVSIANSIENTAAVRAAMEQAWRTIVRVPWEEIKSRPSIPADFFVDSERSMNENSIDVRADRVLLNVTGDIFDLMSVILVDDLEWVLGL